MYAVSIAWGAIRSASGRLLQGMRAVALTTLQPSEDGIQNG